MADSMAEAAHRLVHTVSGSPDREHLIAVLNRRIELRRRKRMATAFLEERLRMLTTGKLIDEIGKE